MSYALDFHSGKTVESSILRVETLDSPRTVSTGESPQKKRGAAILFSRRESVLQRSILILNSDRGTKWGVRRGISST
jgi:hypothetical protein